MRIQGASVQIHGDDLWEISKVFKKHWIGYKMLCGYGGDFLLRYKVMPWWEISTALFSKLYKMLCFSFKTQGGALVGNIKMVPW